MQECLRYLEIVSERYGKVVVFGISVVKSFCKAELILDADEKFVEGVAGTYAETHLETLAVNFVFKSVARYSEVQIGTKVSPSIRQDRP